MKKSVFLLNIAALSLVLCLGGCKKDKTSVAIEDPGTNNSDSKKYVLVIDNGAQSMEVGQTLNLSAHLVSSEGIVVSASGVTWSSNIGGISGAAFSINTETIGVISASVQYEGNTYTSAIPVNIQPSKSSQLFAVVPSAIIWQTNSGPMALNTVYLGGGSASYAFSSDNSSIASVSGAGVITFNAAGNTNIKVTATINGQASVVNVPVMVLGTPEVPLPVTRIVVDPVLGELFRGETLQLNAKAYNSKGDDVTGTVTFNYTIKPKLEDDNEPAIAANVSATGLVKALTIGGAYVNVSASGVMGQAEIVVNPDTVIIVNPYFVTLGGMDFSQMPPVQGPTSAVLTASTKKIDRARYRAKDPSFLVSIPNSPTLMWDLPETGIPQIDEQFKVVTLENKTNTTVTVKAIPQKFGSTMVVAHDGIYGGAAPVLVNP